MEQVREARPPYVRFGYESVEDRDASIANGYYTEKQVAFAYLTPSGTKDVIPRRVDEWLVQTKDQAHRGTIPFEWAESFANAFKRWKENNEIPEFGTPIMTWPVLSPGERSAVLAANIRTVEDLAAATEQGMMAVGMNSRAIKQKAVDWMESASSNGKVVQELEALRVKNDQLSARLDEAMKVIQELSAEQDDVTNDAPKRRGRPPKASLEEAA